MVLLMINLTFNMGNTLLNPKHNTQKFDIINSYKESKIKKI